MNRVMVCGRALLALALLLCGAGDGSCCAPEQGRAAQEKGRRVSAAPGEAQDPGKAGQTAQVGSAAGRQLLEAVLEASGGSERLAAIRSLQWRSQETYHLDDGKTLEVKLEAVVVFPDRFRAEYRVQTEQGGEEKAVQCLDHDRGWRDSKDGVKGLPLSRVGDLRKSLALSTTQLLRLGGALAAERLPDEERDGRLFRRLRVSGAQLPASHVDLWIDPQTGRIAAREMEMLTSRGAVQRSEQMGDYREVAGVWLPFHRRIYDQDKLRTEVRITGYTINGKVEEALFVRPGAPRQ